MPRHAIAPRTPRAFGLLPRRAPDAATTGRRRPAELGTVRGAVWTGLGAIIFLAMSHPSIIQAHWPTTLLWVSGLTAVVLLVDIRHVRLPRLPPLVLAFLGFCLFSLLWTPDTGATSMAVLLYAAIALLGAVLVENMTGPLFIRAMSMGALLVMVLSLWAVWIGHPNAVGPSGQSIVLQGLYGNRNIMAYVMVLGLAALLADRYRSWPGQVWKWVLVIAALAMMVFVRSGTGTVSVVLLVGVALVGVVVRNVPVRLRRPFGVGVLALGSAALVVAVANMSRVIDILGKDQTFSGRTPLWRGIVDAWSDSELAGYGWGSVWAYAWNPTADSAVRDRINAYVGSPLNHGHNAVLDILIQVGLVGTAIYLGIIVTTVLRGLRSWGAVPSPERSWVLIVLLAVCVSGVTEPLFAAPLGWFMVSAAACSAAKTFRGGPPHVPGVIARPSHEGEV